jgi:hypothetical protein
MSNRPPGAYEAPGCKPDVNTNAVMSSGRVKEKASMNMSAKVTRAARVRQIVVLWMTMPFTWCSSSVPEGSVLPLLVDVEEAAAAAVMMYSLSAARVRQIVVLWLTMPFARCSSSVPEGSVLPLLAEVAI